MTRLKGRDVKGTVATKSAAKRHEKQIRTSVINNGVGARFYSFEIRATITYRSPKLLELWLRHRSTEPCQPRLLEKAIFCALYRFS